MHARALLLEVALQYHRDDNGRMLLSRAHLLGRGWKSADMIQKAKGELLEAELIFETVKGQRPNKASWYACTWWRLDRHPGFDSGVEKAFEQGAYRLRAAVGTSAVNGNDRTTNPPLVTRVSRVMCDRKAPTENASLVPPHGTGSTAIGPPHGTESAPPVPPHGAIRPVLTPSSVPPHGNPLDMPSAGVRARPLEPLVSSRRPLANGSEVTTTDLMARLGRGAR